jgi:hypothetical protein
MLDQNFLKIFHHIGLFSPIQRPETWFETIFGPSLKLTQFQDMYMKTGKKDSFFIENYKFIFLPDWLSEFLLQVK